MRYRMESLEDMLAHYQAPVIQRRIEVPLKREWTPPKQVVAQQESYQSALPLAYYHRYMPLELTQEEVDYLTSGKIKRTSRWKRLRDQRKALKWGA